MVKDENSSLGLLSSSNIGGGSGYGKQIPPKPSDGGAPVPIGFHALTNAPYYGGGLQDKREVDSYRHSSNTSYGHGDLSNR